MKTPYRYIPVLSPEYRSLKRSFLSQLYSGSEVWCPVCSYSFKSWLNNQENGECPHCRSACRHRMLCLYLTDIYSSDNNPVKVLFFAPNWGLERWFCQHKEFHCVTTDLAAPGVDFHADITNLPIADCSYDLVLCSHVLEHIPDDAQAISELFRILPRGGNALIQVPLNRYSEHTDEDLSITNPIERARRFGQFDHVRLYGHDIVEKLKVPGFNVETLNLLSRLNSQDCKRLGLWDDTIFVCKKPM